LAKSAPDAWKNREEIAADADLREARERLDAARENMIGVEVE